jgi:hypothetical protein
METTNPPSYDESTRLQLLRLQPQLQPQLQYETQRIIETIQLQQPRHYPQEEQPPPSLSVKVCKVLIIITIVVLIIALIALNRNH